MNKKLPLQEKAPLFRGQFLSQTDEQAYPLAIKHIGAHFSCLLGKERAECF